MKRALLLLAVIPALVITQNASATTSEIFRPVEPTSRAEKASIVGRNYSFYGGSHFGVSPSVRSEAFRKSCERTLETYCSTDSFVKEVLNNPEGTGAFIVLPYCESSVSKLCLDGVFAANQKLKYVRDLAPFSPTSNYGNVNAKVKGSTEIGLPDGGVASIWDFPKSLSGVDNSYLAVSVSYSVIWQKDGTPRYNSAYYSLTPFIYSDWNGLKEWINPPPGKAGPTYGVNINGKLCKYPVFLETQSCPQEIALPEGLLFKVSANLPAQLGGWFNGRIDEPKLSITTVDSKVNRVEVEGKTIRIPRLSVISRKGDVEYRSGVSTVYPDDAAEDNINKFVDRIRPLTNDRSTGSSVIWSIRTVEYARSKCLQNQNKLLGFVTSNALTYQGSAPKMESGFLTYQLSGMKYEKDGSLTRGNYNLVMRSEVARCLFSLDKKLIRASVSIIYPDNTTKNVATENLGERNGWIYIQARNFTFSNPKVRVALK